MDVNIVFMIVRKFETSPTINENEKKKNGKKLASEKKKIKQQKN